MNTPLLAYTLDALANANVDKCYIYARTGMEQLRSYLSSSPYGSASNAMQIILRSTTATSHGDVMREVDALQLKVNFYLVHVGYIGNLDLTAAMETFAKKRKADSGLVMDCLVAPSSVGKPAIRTLHVMNAATTLLHYEHAPAYPRSKRIRIPREVLASEQPLIMRADLQSIGIDLCSPEVCHISSRLDNLTDAPTRFRLSSQKTLTTSPCGRTSSMAS